LVGVDEDNYWHAITKSCEACLKSKPSTDEEFFGNINTDMLFTAKTDDNSTNNENIRKSKRLQMNKK